MPPDSLNNTHISTLMKELSDIKSSLAVNTNETANIKQSIAEIKTDVKDIKSDGVNRREFNDTLGIISELRKDVQFLQKVAYGGLTLLGAVQFYLNFILK